MEVWLLGAGAIVLIAITLWIVWPAHPDEAPVTTAQDEEVSTTHMSENTIGSGMMPQGDRFEDQYTSATADLSAGGVAMAMDNPAYTEPVRPPTEPNPGSPAPVSSVATWSPPTTYPDDGARPAAQTRTRVLGIGAGTAMTLGASIGGAWLYARWQRERNKPINRLRRNAREVASRLGERLPDVDDLPRGTAPMGGAATALLLASLVASRALRGGSSDGRERATEQASDLFDRGRDVAQRGRKQALRVADRWPLDRMSLDRLPLDRVPSHVDAPRPAVFGIGFGGLAILAGATYLVWRVLRGGGPNPSAWNTPFAGE